MPEDVSQLLTQWSDGSREAFDRLMPIVYDQMRNLGRRHLAWRRGESLQPTVLIHETWMRLASKEGLELRNRLQFFALSSQIIRDILRDYYRKKKAAKHGGGLVKVQAESADAGGSEPSIDFLALNEAIDELARIKPRYAHIVELRFIAGFSVEETAEFLQISVATVERDWTFAKVWLRRALSHSS